MRVETESRGLLLREGVGVSRCSGEGEKYTVRLSGCYSHVICCIFSQIVIYSSPPVDVPGFGEHVNFLVLCVIGVCMWAYLWRLGTTSGIRAPGSENGCTAGFCPEIKLVGSNF